MSRRLILLNLALAAAVFVIASRARDNWNEARKRAEVGLGARIPKIAAPPLAPLPELRRATAADFADVAQQTLFSRDRNPTVVVEVAPPKPMPPLPVLRGVLDVGSGPVAFMAPKSGDGFRMTRAGESVGDFKVVALTQESVVLEWDGKRLEKRVSDLLDRTAAEAGAVASVTPVQAAPRAQPIVTTTSTPAGPGSEMSPGIRTCQRGDDSPPGTIVDGYKKIVSDSPFGKICRWEAVR